MRSGRLQVLHSLGVWGTGSEEARAGATSWMAPVDECPFFYMWQSLKRKERQKKKSAREWKARIKQVEKSKREKQEKRQTNLAERKTKNKALLRSHASHPEDRRGGPRGPLYSGWVKVRVLLDVSVRLSLK